MKWGFIYLYCGSNRNNSKRNCTMHCNAKTVDSSIICAPNELLKIIWFWSNNQSLLWVHIIWQFQMINQHLPIQLNFIHCCQVIIETQWLLGSLYWSLVIGSVVKWPLWRSFQISRKHFVYLPQQPAMQTNPLRPARASESLCITFSLTFVFFLFLDHSQGTWIALIHFLKMESESKQTCCKRQNIYLGTDIVHMYPF